MPQPSDCFPTAATRCLLQKAASLEPRFLGRGIQVPRIVFEKNIISDVSNQNIIRRMVSPGVSREPNPIPEPVCAQSFLLLFSYS